MMSLPKTMENNGEMRTSAKPNKLYINRKVLMRAIQKCTSYWIWATMSKVVGIFVKFWHFLWCPLTKCGHITWPKKQISKTFLIILHLILGKITKFPVEKLSTSEVSSQKIHGGLHPPPPSAFRVNSTCHITIMRTGVSAPRALVLICARTICFAKTGLVGGGSVSGGVSSHCRIASSICSCKSATRRNYS